MNERIISEKIDQALKDFQDGTLLNSARNLLNTLGYDSTMKMDLYSNHADYFISEFDKEGKFNKQRALTEDWESIDFLFQLTEEDIFDNETSEEDVSSSQQFDDTKMESYVFFAVKLREASYSRTQLSNITREINKPMPMPAMIIFQHGQTLTFAVIDRRLHKRDETKDVLKKVTIIKDIDFKDAHRAHIKILFDLSRDELFRVHSFRNFVELHHAWKKTLDIQELNKRFYSELSNWYFWAVDNVTFPDDAGEDIEIRNATSVIRLITRLIFVWFIKERKLVPDTFFNQRKIENILNSIDPQESTYYKAILQNLFFATLNQEMNTPEKPNNRKFRGEGRQHYNITSLYRYKKYFTDSDKALRRFEEIPFLNGGLFECLDKSDEDDPKKILRIDGFSDRKDNQLSIPNFLFFSEEKYVDLNKVYGTKGKRYKVRGLIEILRRYKFTITENTPIEEEVALDPELLGKVFENLLAAYNPETRTTARKQTGSYYTPREIVNYMVDESLIAYLKSKLIDYRRSESTFSATSPPSQLDLSGQTDPMQTELDTQHVELTDKQKCNIEKKLRNLVAYKDEPHQFDEEETEQLINAIDTLKILDPACGSGAFPMGILQKLVFILGKLDPDNDQWRQRQIDKVKKTIKAAEDIEDSTVREDALAELETEIDNINDAFQRNELNYGRKLYLIENCIYGVDIQPIAAQIAKLRFFISLIIDQRIDDARENRGVRPLPNLETNFIAANTLLGITGQLPFRSPEIIEKEKELDEVRRRSFAARTPKTKEKYRTRYTESRKEISKLLIDKGLESNIAGKISSWDPYNQNSTADWYNSERMFGVVDGFDVVIGNPPYIKEYTYREAFDGLRDSPYYQGKMDIWYMFACEGLDLVKKDNGLVTFIAQNNWVTSAGASKMRNKVIQDAQILSLVDFGGFKIFSSGIQTMIMVFRKNIETNNYPFDCRRLLGKDLNMDDVMALLNRDQNNKAKYINPIIKRSKYTNTTLTFSDPEVELILSKILSKAQFRLYDREIANGIHHHHDFVNRQRNEVLGNEYKIGDGIFVISQEEKDLIPFTQEELNFIKPSYTTKELHRFYANPTNREWVIYTDSSFKDHTKIKNYPNIKKHLYQFREVITSDNKPYGLHRARNPFFFQGEKIISVRKCARPTFTYVDFDSYVSAAFYVIKTGRFNQKYLTGILNSRLVTFWLKHKGKMQGTNYQIDKQPLLAIPLILPPPEKQLSIASLVDEILDAKHTNPDKETSDRENKIDKLVYELYNLTSEEIAIVEASVNFLKKS